MSNNGSSIRQAGVHSVQAGREVVGKFMIFEIDGEPFVQGLGRKMLHVYQDARSGLYSFFSSSDVSKAGTAYDCPGNRKVHAVPSTGYPVLDPLL